MNIVNILAIESSCDDTSAAVLQNNIVLSNIIASQEVHKDYGGVVPELASRAHQQNIIPVVHQALSVANLHKNSLHAIAYTRGPGLLGSLLVGGSFAKSMAMSLSIPLIDTDHLAAHIFALFIDTLDVVYEKPEFPFIALLVSGGHTRLAIVHDYLNIEFVGDTIDDAAGETFDKSAKMLGLHYPGGPIIDKLAKLGNPYKYTFNKPRIPDFNFSFSGLKTSILYFLRDELKKNDKFIDDNLHDLCASIQHIIVEILLDKTSKLVEKTGIKHVGVVGGVSANYYLRKILLEYAKNNNVKMFFPAPQFTTDNAAMVGMLGYLKYQKGLFDSYSSSIYSTS